MSKKIRFSIFLSMMIFFSIYAEANTNNINSETNLPITNHKYNCKIILITTTHSCHCVLSRCHQMENNIKGIINSFSTNDKKLIYFTNINLYKYPKLANRIMKKYNLYFAPKVVVLDKDNNPLYREPFNFKKDEFKKAIEKSLKDVKK